MENNLKSMLFPPKVFTIDELMEAKAKSDDQVIKELGEQGCISFGIIDWSEGGGFKEIEKFKPKKSD